MSALVTLGKSSGLEWKNNATEEKDMSQKAREFGCAVAFMAPVPRNTAQATQPLWTTAPAARNLSNHINNPYFSGLLWRSNVPDTIKLVWLLPLSLETLWRDGLHASRSHTYLLGKGFGWMPQIWVIIYL